MAMALPLAAQTTILDRGLPPTAGGLTINRVGPQDPDSFIGDEFIIGNDGETWIIDKLRTWAVIEIPTARTSPDDLFESVTLYGGIANDPPKPGDSAQCDCHGPVALKTLALPRAKTTAGSSEVTITPMNRRAGNLELWQVDFKNLRWSVPGGVALQFVVKAARRNLPGKTTAVWFNHVSPVNQPHHLRVFDRSARLRSFYESQEGTAESVGINIQVYAHRGAQP